MLESKHVVYYWDGSNETVNEGEYKNRLTLDGCFDCLLKAVRYKYKYKVTMWSVPQACNILAGDNPDSINPLSEKAKQIYLLIEQAYMSGKLRLDKRENLKGESEYRVSSSVVIAWAVEEGISLPEIFLDYQQASKGKKAEQEKRLNEVLGRIISIAEQMGAPINKNQFPGTKNELIAIVKKMDGYFTRLTSATLADYFATLDIKFMPGTREGKCEIIKALERAISQQIDHAKVR